MTVESGGRTGRFWIITIALAGAIPLSCLAILMALLILLFSDDPHMSTEGYFELASIVLIGCLAVAWLPLPVAFRLSNRGMTRWAYSIAFIPPVLLAGAVAFFILWR